MKKLMGLLLSAALLTGLLAGCAGTPAENNSTNTLENTPAVSDTSTPEASAEVKEAAWPRTIEDDFGHTITLEKKPERVVTLYFGHIESLYVLGTPPVGSPRANATINGSGALKQYAEELNVIDLGNQPNMEKILELSPDLILGTAASASAYEDYNKIAPTLIFDSADWKDVLNNYAKCLGAESVAEQFIDELDSIIVQSRKKLSAYEGKTFVVAWDLGKNTFGAFGTKKTSQTAWYDKEVGFGLTPPERYPEDYGQISLESLADFNPDYIFIANQLSSEENNYEPIYLQEGTEGSSIWKSLKAVQSGNVFFLPLGSVSGAPLGQKLAIEMIVDSVVH